MADKKKSTKRKGLFGGHRTRQEQLDAMELAAMGGKPEPKTKPKKKK